MTIAILLYIIAGPFWFSLLHRMESWPSRPWIGWACFVAAGPLTWLVLGLAWLGDRR